MICIIFYTNLVASFHIDEVMFMGNKGIQLSAKTLVPDKNFCNQSYMGFAQVEKRYNSFSNQKTAGYLKFILISEMLSLDFVKNHLSG